MSIEALWTVEFISNLGVFGSGVVVFETERIFGGDAKYYYLGNYKVSHDGFLDGEVKVAHFAGDPYSVFGNRGNFKLKLSGKINEPIMDINGSVIGEPHLKILLRLTHKEDLP